MHSVNVIIIAFCVMPMIQHSSATIPAYSMVLVSHSLESVSRALPAARALTEHLVPYLGTLLANINSLSNVVQHLTPASLPYFGCSLPLLSAALTETFSVFLMYIGTLVSLVKCGAVGGGGLFSLGKSLLDCTLVLLGCVEDADGCLVSLTDCIKKVVECL